MGFAHLATFSTVTERRMNKIVHKVADKKGSSWAKEIKKDEGKKSQLVIKINLSQEEDANIKNSYKKSTCLYWKSSDQ